MPLIPWEYIKKSLSLPKITPKEIEEKLIYYGLETKAVERKNSLYLEFNPLPNRLDLFSWWGVIQEIGIILNCPVNPTSLPVVSEKREKLIEVVINTSDCLEFFLGLIKNIEVKESPGWVKDWLTANNIRSINNAVDSVNLVMLESGQPLHILDYDALPEKKIVVRPAYPGEKINALHGQELVLNSEDIVISSGEKIISLAGIIGNQTTALTSNTKNVLIECASFNSTNIKKTAKSLNVSAAASHFFSRQNNLLLTAQQVLARVISLIIETYQGDLDSGSFFSCRKIEKKPQLITISQEFITKKTGQMLSSQTIENVWKQLKITYQKEEDIYYINPPSSRPDITSPEDLLEELLRIYDYNKLIGSLPDNFPITISNIKKKHNEKQEIILKTYLTNQGWQEVITYSLISSEMKNDFDYPSRNVFFQLLMPKNEYHEYYRQTLIPSHLKTLNYNLSRGNKDLFFFEISSIYGSQNQEKLLVLSGVGKFFNQPLHKLVQEIDFYWLKGTLENIFSLWQIETEVSFALAPLSYLYPPQSAEIILGGGKVGFFGRLHPQIAQKYQINETIFIAQISLDQITNYLDDFSPKTSYQPVSTFPTSIKDLSFVFSENINYDEVIKVVKETADNNLQEVKVFDIYQSTELERERKKSVSFHLIFQSPTKTLERKEIEKILKNIIERVEKTFAGKLRG